MSRTASGILSGVIARNFLVSMGGQKNAPPKRGKRILVGLS